MLFWLQVTAAVFLGIAGIVSSVRYSKAKNTGQLFIGIAFLLAAAIFGGLAMF